MAAKTRELKRLWWDWLSTAERLQHSLEEQSIALVRRDVTTVERIQPELETMLARMKRIDEEAAACVERLAAKLETEPSLGGLMRAVDAAEAQQLQVLGKRVAIVGENIARLLEENRRLIENELLYVNGSLSLIMKAAQEQAGPYAGKEAPPVLLDEVA